MAKRWSTPHSWEHSYCCGHTRDQPLNRDSEVPFDKTGFAVDTKVAVAGSGIGGAHADRPATGADCGAAILRRSLGAGRGGRVVTLTCDGHA